MKREADEIIPLLKASSYRCKAAPVYDPYSPDPRHKTILYKTGLPQQSCGSLSALLSLFAVAHCGSITGNSDITRLGEGSRRYAHDRLSLPTTRFVGPSPFTHASHVRCPLYGHLEELGSILSAISMQTGTGRRPKRVSAWRDHTTPGLCCRPHFRVLRSAQSQWRSPLTSQGSQSKTQRFWILRGTLRWSESRTGSIPSAFSGSLSAESVYSWPIRVSIGAKRVRWRLPLCLICRFRFW
jgi:hypothetical protein